ncbi:Crp/Fnr family transcriptional regulator [Pontibacter chinhatensis]|uniref:cAMP-binding domain of CRP or a regulatory subunit of cAMP-dependent protein kinases n=1 Tax=Pontibacter chinhatensis TaxID=1436961 RepID=A0A1I2X6A3_9BACT|nr:Crp/Fnr family transcriptional regulator [Pontibacter chinhatensis]SFH08557.1 cAMP-binding domain of CRP or a regulatory subunit of cAMP-dependent protein kinases [Pontibacter chinhatensis]
MYELFFEEFNKKVPITAEEQEQIKHYLTPKKLRRKQYLLQEGDVCKFIAFVEKGALRAYSVDENFTENIIQFGLEGWTISDLYSFLTEEPAVYNIDALEDSELVLISKSAHEEMLQTIPKYETYTRLNITGAYLAMQRRITTIISSTAEERYQDFINLYPHIAQRVPQHMIASYIGLTPETLSRIRKKLSSGK